MKLIFAIALLVSSAAWAKEHCYPPNYQEQLPKCTPQNRGETACRGGQALECKSFGWGVVGHCKRASSGQVMICE